jgi:hypothetical protein
MKGFFPLGGHFFAHLASKFQKVVTRTRRNNKFSMDTKKTYADYRRNVAKSSPKKS